MRIILASSSPRRKEILTSLNINYEVIPSLFDEVYPDELKKEEIVIYLANQKAEEVYNKNQDAIVIGSDTIVYHKGRVLGKPKDKFDCFEMLKSLSGDTHSVLTGVALLSKDKKEIFYCESFVEFKPLTDEEIYEYIDTLEPLDKAGGYAIQGIGKKLVLGYSGDFYNIVGLPKEMVNDKLKEIINIYK